IPVSNTVGAGGGVLVTGELAATAAAEGTAPSAGRDTQPLPTAVTATTAIPTTTTIATSANLLIDTAGRYPARPAEDGAPVSFRVSPLVDAIGNAGPGPAASRRSASSNCRHTGRPPGGTRPRRSQLSKTCHRPRSRAGMSPCHAPTTVG